VKIAWYLPLVRQEVGGEGGEGTILLMEARTEAQKETAPRRKKLEGITLDFVLN
jgi:hypothetical protein